MEQVRTKFNELDTLTDRVHGLTDQLESTTTQKEFKAVHSGFRDEIQKANQLIRVIKSQIDALDVSNKDFEKKHSEGKGTEIEFRKVTWAGFSNRLRASLINFNKAQSRFDAMFNKRTGESGFNPDLTLDRSPGRPGAMSQAFAMANSDDDAIKREDMKRLEKSLREIREAFLQVATLVESQGEMLDCIEFSTVNAKNYAHLANIQLIQARKKQRMRGWLWFMLGFCCILILVLVILGAMGFLKVN